MSELEEKKPNVVPCLPQVEGMAYSPAISGLQSFCFYFLPPKIVLFEMGRKLKHVYSLKAF